MSWPPNDGRRTSESGRRGPGRATDKQETTGRAAAVSCGGGEDAYMAAGRLGPTPCPMPAAATGAGGSGPLVVVTDSDEHIELTSGRKVDDEHGRTATGTAFGLVRLSHWPTDWDSR